MTRGLGLRVLGASHMGHAHDGARRGARGWCKFRELEVVGCDVRRKGKVGGDKVENQELGAESLHHPGIDIKGKSLM